MAAIKSIHESKPDMILLDISMPEISGLELLVKMRNTRGLEQIPIILISGLTETETVVNGLRFGANDYVTQPIDLPVLVARMHTHLKLANTVSHLASQSQKLSELASSDELTGLCNRRVLFRVMQRELNRAVRYKHPLAFLMIDCDNFKQVNDEHGHRAGDHLLRELAQRLSALVRTSDTVCRYGGEEFCAVMPHTDLESAMRASEHIRKTIEESVFLVKGAECHLTVSIGAAAFSGTRTPDVDRLISRADKALYHAKNSGKNKVCGHTGSSDPSRKLVLL